MERRKQRVSMWKTGEGPHPDHRSTSAHQQLTNKRPGGHFLTNFDSRMPMLYIVIKRAIGHIFSLGKSFP